MARTMDNESGFFYLALGPEEIDQVTGSAERIKSKILRDLLDEAVDVVLKKLERAGISGEEGNVDPRDYPDDHVLRKIVVSSKNYEKAVDLAAKRVKELPIGRTGKS